MSIRSKAMLGPHHSTVKDRNYLTANPQPTQPNTMTTIEIHPIANLLPKMPEEDFASLRDDIRANGCHTPIVLFEGQILDGRHRYLACQHTGRDFTTNTYRDGDPVGFVRSLNLHRRNLTAAQRAIVEVALSEWLDNGKKPTSAPGAEVVRTEKPQKTASEMAESAEVSTRSIEQAKAIAREASPEVKEAVTQGKMSLKAAAATLPAKPKLAPPTPRPPSPQKAAIVFPADIEKAVARLGRLIDAETENAYRRGTFRPQDIASINILSDAQIRKIAGLAFGSRRWTVKRALKFTSRTINQASRISDLINWCIARNGKFEFTIQGHKISVLNQGGYS